MGRLMTHLLIQRQASLALLFGALLTVGCSACSTGPEGDANSDAASDADIADGDSEAEDADIDEPRDAEEVDSDVESLFDGSCLADPGDGGVLMDIEEVTSSSRARDCGQGCRQISFEAPVLHWGMYNVSGRYLVYLGEVDRVQSFLIDLETMREYRLDGNPDYIRTLPGIDGDVLTYSTGGYAYDDFDRTLWRYRIGDCARHPLVTRRLTERGRPMHDFSISAGRVAWYDSAISAAGLYVMSLEGGEVTTLTPDHCVCYGHTILDGNTAVFEGWHTGPREIWMVNVDTLKQMNLTNNPYPQFEHDFDGQWTVWTDGRNDPCDDPYGSRCNSDIYGMRMPNGEQEALCSDPSTQLHPSVHNGLVVWEDFRHAEDPNDAWAHDPEIEIYLLDLETRREVRLTNLSGPELWPHVDNGRVFFVAADRYGEPALFMIDLEEAGVL